MRYANQISLGFLCLWLCSCASPAAEKIEAATVLEACFSYHDPNNEWPSWAGEYVVIEPRLRNAGRRSEVVLDPSAGVFEIERAYGADIIRRTFSSSGHQAYLNGQVVTDTALINQHRLTSERSEGHRQFYTLMLGMPVSLKGRYRLLSPMAIPMQWKGYEVCKVEMEVEDAPIATHWELFVDSKNYRLRAYRLLPEDGVGEYLMLDQEMEVRGMKWPRVKHWYASENDEYLGSDLILSVSAIDD